MQIGLDVLEAGGFLYYSACADVIFLTDMCVGFLTSYTTVDAIEILQPRLTAKHYLATWCMLAHG